MILGFHSKQLTERGTEVALLAYADAAREILGHDVRIFVPADTARIVPDVRRRVEERFEVVFYKSPGDIICDALYVIKRGHPGRITENLPELNHAFFDGSMPHGHRFATVSGWVSHLAVRHVRLPRGRVVNLPRLRKPPVVPHIIELPDVRAHLRDELRIPEDAVVFGRHGGRDTFRIDFVKDAIQAALAARDNLWFVFVHTDQFIEHPRVLNLPLIVDRADLRRYINTCDYMIHAHTLGETFGLAVGEFAYAGVPVVTYVGAPRLAHVDLLNDELLVPYLDYDDVLRDFMTLPRRLQPYATDVPLLYSPERVIARFDEIFLR